MIVPDDAYARSCDRTAEQFARAERREQLVRRLRIAAKIIGAPILAVVLIAALLAGTFGGRR